MPPPLSWTRAISRAVGAAEAAILRPSFAFGEAIRRGQWDEVLALTAPDFELIDHRGLWPALDRNEAVARYRSGYDEMPDMIWINRTVTVRGQALLLVNDISGADAQGARYSWVQYAVSTTSDDGLIERQEVFEDDQFAAALARLDELAASRQ